MRPPALIALSRTATQWSANWGSLFERFDGCRALAIVFVLFSALVSCPALWAQVIAEFKPVIIEPGDLVEQSINVDRSSGMRVEIRLLSPPDGALLLVSNEGQLMLEWETGPELPDETRLMIQVKNVDTQAVIETRELLVLNSFSVAGSQATTESPPEIASANEKATISLYPIANQIISSGRAVSIRLNATSSDGEDPLISLDRVPRNATFDKNVLGSYTFFWQTGDRDQGEHVFRVTAKHPSVSGVVATDYLTVVVGDPTRGITLPDE